MTSLTQTAVTARKIIRWGLFFFVFLIVARIVIGGGIKIYRKLFPAPPPPPTVTFGKLPTLPFPVRNTLNQVSFTLETAAGGYPKLPTQAKVFFMPKPAANLLSLDVAKEKAEALGFLPQESEVSPTLYRFSHKVNPSTLEINIVSGIFSVSYDLKADSTPLQRRPPVAEVAASQVRAFLSSADLLPADLTGPTTPEFLKLSEDKFVGALSLSEANLVKINLFRKSYDNLPSLTPDPNSANVWFMVSGTTEREKQIIAGQFHYFSVDETQFSTYPTKTSQDAWNELTSGKAYFASTGVNKEGDSIKIRKIYLAYYDAGVTTNFFQPIIVFEGDKGFLAYVPAVTPDYYGD